MKKVLILCAAAAALSGCQTNFNDAQYSQYGFTYDITSGTAGKALLQNTTTAPQPPAQESASAPVAEPEIQKAPPTPAVVAQAPAAAAPAEVKEKPAPAEPAPETIQPDLVKNASGSPLVNRVGMACTPSGKGYWVCASDGSVFRFGDAHFFGSMRGGKLNKPIAGMVARPQGDGYWLFCSDGGIFSFGKATFCGSGGDKKIKTPVVGMACTQSGDGYWLMTRDGDVFAYGDAVNAGSESGKGMNDFVGIAPAWHKDGSNGYWMVRSTGQIYTHKCEYYGGGEAGGLVVSIASHKDDGYWETRATGEIYSYRLPAGGGGANEDNKPFVAVCAMPSGTGYWLVKKDGSVLTYGDAEHFGDANF